MSTVVRNQSNPSSAASYLPLASDLNFKIFIKNHIVTSTENSNKYFYDTDNKSKTPQYILAAVAHRGYAGKYGYATGVEQCNSEDGLHNALVHIDPTPTGATWQLFYMIYHR